MRQDEVLYSKFMTQLPSVPRFLLPSVRPHADSPTYAAIGIADRVKNFAVLYVCDLDQVPDFKQMYELYDPVTLMFFFRNKHMVGWRLVFETPLLLLANFVRTDVRFWDRQ